MKNCLFFSLACLLLTSAALPFLNAPAGLRIRYDVVSDNGTMCETRDYTFSVNAVPGATTYEWSWSIQLPSGTVHHGCQTAPKSAVSTEPFYNPGDLSNGKLTLKVRAVSGSEVSAWTQKTFTICRPNVICP